MISNTIKNISGIIKILLCITFFCSFSVLDDKHLTENEIYWLSTNHELLEVLYEEQCPPLSFSNRWGDYTGYYVDYIAEIERLLGYEFKEKRFETRNGLLEYAKKGSMFIIPGADETPLRKEFLSFSPPFETVSLVIVSRSEDPVYFTGGAVSDDSFIIHAAVTKGSVSAEYLREEYPYLKLVEYDNNRDCIGAVASGVCSIAVMNQLEASAYIAAGGGSRLAVTGVLPRGNRLSMAVSAGDPVLARIMDKAVGSMEPQRTERLFMTWIGYRRIWLSDSLVRRLIAAGWIVLSVFMIFLIWVFFLRRVIGRNKRDLRRSYYTNNITGLPNRNRLVKDMQTANLSKIAFFSLKSFGDISNFYGLKIGEKLLRELGRYYIQATEAPGVAWYQYSMSIFALTGSDEIEARDFINLCMELQSGLKGKSLQIEDYEILMEPVAGVVVNEVNLLEKAGVVLKYARDRKISFQVYSEELGLMESLKLNLQRASEIRRAIAADRIVPFYQPIVCNSTGKIQKYETLIRMIDENGEIVPPGEFLTAAQFSGFYSELTRIIVRKAFARFADNEYEFSINLNYSDIINAETRQLIFGLLEQKGIASRAVFEIVESEGFDDSGIVAEFITRVKSSGAKIAIDDFGSGYSNFIYLTSLNIDYIKIDGSIIKNIVEDEASWITTGTIVTFAKNLGISTVAEYVHNSAVYSMVKDLGIDFSQGFYFSEPGPDIEDDKARFSLPQQVR